MRYLIPVNVDQRAMLLPCSVTNGNKKDGHRILHSKAPWTLLKGRQLSIDNNKGMETMHFTAGTVVCLLHVIFV